MLDMAGVIILPTWTELLCSLYKSIRRLNFQKTSVSDILAAIFNRTGFPVPHRGEGTDLSFDVDVHPGELIIAHAQERAIPWTGDAIVVIFPRPFLFRGKNCHLCGVTARY